MIISTSNIRYRYIQGLQEDPINLWSPYCEIAYTCTFWTYDGCISVVDRIFDHLERNQQPLITSKHYRRTIWKSPDQKFQMDKNGRSNVQNFLGPFIMTIYSCWHSKYTRNNSLQGIGRPYRKSPDMEKIRTWYCLKGPILFIPIVFYFLSLYKDNF